MEERTCRAEELTPYEWDEILSITHAAFDEHNQRGIRMSPCSISLEAHKAFLKNCQIFQIRHNDVLIAYKAGLLIKKEGYSYFQVQITCVAPEEKGKGLGKKVHKMLEDWAISNQCSYIQTDTSCKARSSLAYHHSCGFKDWYFTVYKNRNYYSIVLRKDLQNDKRMNRLSRYVKLVTSYFTTRLKYGKKGNIRFSYRCVSSLFHYALSFKKRLKYRLLYNCKGFPTKLHQKVYFHIHPSPIGMKGFEKKLSLKDVQNRTYQLLVYFDQFCKEHGLRYFLCYGSLIGAVRHEGFIPWDDDIDVTMPLPDYERFIKLKEKDSFRPDIGIIYGMKEGAGIPFAMLTDLKTVAYVPGRDFEHTHPVAMDIFPAFALSNDRVEAHEQIDNICNLVTQTQRNFRRPSCLRIIRWFKFALFSQKRLKQQLDAISAIIHRYPWGSTDQIRIMSLEEREYLAMRPDEFEHYRMHPFESGQFRIPETYHEHLTELFGDYMQLPPEELRQGILTEVYQLD